MFNKFKNELANLVADKVNAKNDEVMLLTQEVDKLKLSNDEKASELYHGQKLTVELNATIRKLRENNSELSKENENLYRLNEDRAEEIELLDKSVTELNKENVKLKKSQHTPTKHKQEISKYKETIKKLEIDMESILAILKSNRELRETYEFISNDTNKESVKEVFSHNLSLWMNENNLNDVSASKLTKCNKETLRRLKTGSRGVTINTLQYFDEVLCEYFECSVYELVTQKMEGK